MALGIPEDDPLSIYLKMLPQNLEMGNVAFITSQLQLVNMAVMYNHISWKQESWVEVTENPKAQSDSFRPIQGKWDAKAHIRTTWHVH